MLRKPTLFLAEKVDTAIDLLRAHEPPEGYYLAFSGGKDSGVIKHLADFAKVKYTAHYNVTGIDHPPLVRYIQQYHPDVVWEMPEMSFWRIMFQHRMPPTRKARYCCQLLKENHGEGVILTGIRQKESQSRGHRQQVEGNTTRPGSFVHPIFYWTEDDVWQYTREERLLYCHLYDEGYDRLGCLFCPQSRKRRLIDEERFPKWVNTFQRMFEKLIEVRKERGLKITTWKTGKDVWNWWLEKESS
jgi:phosphoadenosine phosphosulfate reductase